jgi:hypothetical protein
MENLFADEAIKMLYRLIKESEEGNPINISKGREES